MARAARWTATVLVLMSTGCGGNAAPSGPVPAPARYPIVPAPRHIEARSGQFQLDSATRIVLSEPASSELRAIAEAVAGPLRAASGLPLLVVPGPADKQARNAIAIGLSGDSASAEPERYHLVVAPRGATLFAATPSGVARGLETIRQLLPPAGRAIPAVEIDDAPRFRYRGVLLDVARYFYPPEFIEQVIDLLALY